VVLVIAVHHHQAGQALDAAVVDLAAEDNFKDKQLNFKHLIFYNMSIFDRLFRIGKAEANAAVDKLEDPAKMADQILRELRENYQQALQGEAEIKALALQHRATELQYRNSADDWEKKTNDLLDRIETKQLDEAKGNDLAAKAADAHQKAAIEANQFAKMAEKEESAVAVMDLKIKQIKDQIADTENRAKLIQSRAKTAEVSEKINKTLSSVDTDGLVATLNRMDEKASAQEFRAAAYAQLEDSTLSTEQEINKALGTGSSSSALEAIKAKRTKLLN
jgi:phage shock protein A